MPAKSIAIELGGKQRHLRYDFNSLVALEDELGVTVDKIESFVSGSVKLRDLRTLIWAGLVHEDDGITPKDVGAWIDFQNIEKISEKVGRALEAAFPPTDDVKKN